MLNTIQKLPVDRGAFSAELPEQAIYRVLSDLVIPAAIATVVSVTATEIASRRTVGLRACDVHNDRATLEIIVIEHLDGLLRFFVRGHFDEAKAAAAAGHLIHHDGSGCHRAGLAEVLSQLLISNGERQAADEQLVV
jgi:hypothetical protein